MKWTVFFLACTWRLVHTRIKCEFNEIGYVWATKGDKYRSYSNHASKRNICRAWEREFNCQTWKREYQRIKEESALLAVYGQFLSNDIVADTAAAFIHGWTILSFNTCKRFFGLPKKINQLKFAKFLWKSVHWFIKKTPTNSSKRSMDIKVTSTYGDNCKVNRGAELFHFYHFYIHSLNSHMHKYNWIYVICVIHVAASIKFWLFQ